VGSVQVMMIVITKASVYMVNVNAIKMEQQLVQIAMKFLYNVLNTRTLRAAHGNKIKVLQKISSFFQVSLVKMMLEDVMHVLPISWPFGVVLIVRQDKMNS
jgi:hypothetical protein